MTDIDTTQSKAARATEPETDCISICVPTPLGAHSEPDLSYVHRTAETIASQLRPGQLILVESTTYPETTEREVLPILERSGLKVGRDVFLAFSPEREDPRNTHFELRKIPKIVGGIIPACGKLATAYYSIVFDRIVSVSLPAVAEGRGKIVKA